MTDIDVHVMRAIPGAGKTHLANELAGENGIICSADEFRMVNGEYVFDPKENPIVHAKCMFKFLETLRNAHPGPVIVDNTNTQWWEVQNYVSAGRLAGRPVTIHEFYCNYNKALLCAERNTHGVPTDKVLDMWAKFERAHINPGYEIMRHTPKGFE